MTGSGSEVGRKWAGSGLEVPMHLSVHPKYFPYLLDEPYARDLQAQGACALRFFIYVFLCEAKEVKILILICYKKVWQTFY